LRGLAAVAAAEGDDHRAARLAGAAAAHRHDDWDDAMDARLRAAFFDVARSRIGAHAWAIGLQQGSGMAVEAAIAE
jgi:hypothetical protein